MPERLVRWENLKTTIDCMQHSVTFSPPVQILWLSMQHRFFKKLHEFLFILFVQRNTYPAKQQRPTLSINERRNELLISLPSHRSAWWNNGRASASDAIGRGFDPDRIIAKTLTMVVMASLLSAQCRGNN